jgi:magnesium transporter
LRKSIFPLRDAMRTLLRDESDLIEEINMKYYRDVFDHLNYTCETLDGYKDNISGLIDLYNSSMNDRLNNIMRVLTVVSTIFIPLTFIAGIYGMNFDHMPELHYRYAYPITLGVMTLIGIVMFVIMLRKKWL